MRPTREVNRMVGGGLLAFLFVTLAAAYWAIIGPDTILTRADNPRRVEAEAAIIRGDILDRVGRVLATSSATGSGGSVVRVYPYPETSSVTGYASLRYGVGGAEAAWNAILRGDAVHRDSGTVLMESLLHRPQRGADVRLTLDLDVQQEITAALDGHAGAVVVLAVPSGAVLGLASLPSFDPNTLDADWDRLAVDSGRPFFNRALQGSYQPGGTFQTPLLAAGLIEGYPLDQATEGATAPLEIDNLTLSCAARLPFDALTLSDAFAFACPQPFAQLASALGPEMIEETLQRFHFYDPPALAGFAGRVQTDSAIPLAASLHVDADNMVVMALGQGRMVVSPLEMAVMAAAIVNDGNGPQPYLLEATRATDTADWTTAVTLRPTLPYTTAATARRLQDLMRATVASGAALNAARLGVDIGGHATQAYSGDSAQAWFVGFATLPGKRGLAVAVVLEDSSDPGLAADIGGRALEAAHSALNTE